MATITVRVDDETRAELEELARSRGTSLSVLVRSLLEGLALPKTTQEPRPDSVAPRSLSAYERQMLALQHRILAHVMLATYQELNAIDENAAQVEGDPEHQRGKARILESGYVTEYDDVFASVNPELSAEDCRFVVDVLSLFQYANWHIRRLRQGGTAIDEDLEERLTFSGFDFNDNRESALAEYARFLVTPARWAELLDRFSAEHEHGNSHMPMASIYQRMVDKHHAIISARSGFGPERYRLEVGDLQAIADAATHPGSRGGGSRKSDPAGRSALSSPSLER